MKKLFLYSLVTLLTIFFLTSSTHAAWSIPSAPPPNGSPDSPVNTGPNAQTKAGDLVVATKFTTNDIWTNLFRLATGAGTGKVLQSDASGNASWVATSTLGLGGSGGSGTNYWSLSGSTLYNNSGTNIGIGTSNISNPGGYSSVLYMRGGTAAQGSGIYLGNTANNDSLQLGGWGTAGYVGTAGSGPLYLTTNNSTRATIDAGGNVGIGTTGPDSKLQIDVPTGANGLNIRNSTSGSSWYFYAPSNNTLRLFVSGGGSSIWTASNDGNMTVDHNLSTTGNANVGGILSVTGRSNLEYLHLNVRLSAPVSCTSSLSDQGTMFMYQNIAAGKNTPCVCATVAGSPAWVSMASGGVCP